MADCGSPRLEGRAGAWFGIALLGAISLAAVMARPSQAPLPIEMPEFAAMEVTLPEPLEPLGSHPDMRVMGIEKGPSTDVLCSEERLARMDAFVLGHGVGELFVERASWLATPSGTRAGIASFFSKCRHDGEPLDVLAGRGGELLAVYDPETGLSSKQR